jgi:glycosyltransferase involved in cell wall biosynthesis
VTAVRNGARYLEDTIRSVISLGYPNLKYIIVDGVSSDGTLEIIRKYEKDIVWWASQPDKGLVSVAQLNCLNANRVPSS